MFECEMFGSKLLTPNSERTLGILRPHTELKLHHSQLWTNFRVSRVFSSGHDICFTSCFALLKLRKIDLDPKNKGVTFS